MDRTGKFAYVPNPGNDAVSVYSIDQSTGALTSIQNLQFSTGSEPVFVRVDPTGEFAYVALEGNSTLSVCSINHSTGVLTPISGGSIFTGLVPSSIAVDPRAKFLYVSNESTNNPSDFQGNVSVYSIDHATGFLTPIPFSPFPAGMRSISVALDPTATFVYTANLNSNSVSAYSIDCSGALIPVPGSPFATGSEPGSVAITPK